MKKLAFLMIIMLMLSISCAKKSEKPEATTESETLMPESSSVGLEAQTQTTQPAQNEPAKDALTSQIPEQAGVAVPEKPTTEDIQKALKNAGLYVGAIDGKAGPKTKKAIEEFQKQNNLTADGKVGPKTWEKLKSYLTKVEEVPAASGNLQ